MEEALRLGSMDDDMFERSRRVSWLDLEAIFRSRVLIVGAGALGNETAKDLVLSGVRRITIVDMDRVVGSNLNRCLFFTREHAAKKTEKAMAVVQGLASLCPDSRPRGIVGRIEDIPGEFFEGFDMILGCLDNIPARLHLNSQAYRYGRPLVDGGIDGFLGKVMVCLPPEPPCIQCGMNRSHAKVAGLRFSCTGEDVVFFEPRTPAEITTTSVISAVMVREALKILSGRRDMVLKNCLYYDGARNVSEELEILPEPSCENHPK